MTTPFYDALSEDYDRFVDWESRLSYELPFLERRLQAAGARRVLDVACGTGRHAITLVEHGYDVVGADVSIPMIQQAQWNAAANGHSIPFHVAGFGALSAAVDGTFDVLLCLGNSLPHVLTVAELERTLADFAAVLRPGGVVLIQNRNLDAVMATRDRWMGPEAYRDDGREWLFVRFYDFNRDGTLTFNMLRFTRKGGADWAQRVEQTLLFPWSQAELVGQLRAAGFGHLTFYGDMTGSPFDPATSGNLIIEAIREDAQET
jgi:SAM-dependent methyltransferase